MTDIEKLIFYYGENLNEIQFDGYISGYHCKITRDKFSKHLCGYVNVPKQKYLKIDEKIQCHGGITFWKEETDNITLGFDCAHAGDLTALNLGIFQNCEYRTVKYVKGELYKIILQIENQKIAQSIEIKKSKVGIRCLMDF